MNKLIFFTMLALSTHIVRVVADETVVIPPGKFTMGDTIDHRSDALPVPVYLTAFYMDSNMVTYAHWQSIYTWATNRGYAFDRAGDGKGASHPVGNVDWFDAVKWCNARSEHSCCTPVYYTDPAFTQVYRIGDVSNLYPNWEANGYRLPTEAEWEKAARGGLYGKRFPWGDIISENNANYVGRTNNYDLGPDGYNNKFNDGKHPFTSPVGYFAPNGYGLYDMAGNAYQWCWDWFGVPYQGGTNPIGATSSYSRVQRGGSYGMYADYAMCFFRYGSSDSDFGGGLTFRCVRGPVLGLDVSSNQREIQWSVVRSTGISFAFIRATLGAAPSFGGHFVFLDTNFAQNAHQALAAGIPFAPYHLASPEKNSSPTNEAETFLSQAEPYIGDGFLPPALDIEPESLSIGANVLASWAARWLRYVQDQTHVRPILYGSSSTLAAIGAADPTLVKFYTNWVAKYDGDPTFSNNSTLPNALFKQYSETGCNIGVQGDKKGFVDLNSFNGDPCALFNLTRHP